MERAASARRSWQRQFTEGCAQEELSHELTRQMAASAVPGPLLRGRHLSAHGVNVAATSFHSSAGPEMDGELCGGHPSHREKAMCHELSDSANTLLGGVGCGACQSALRPRDVLGCSEWVFTQDPLLLL